MQLSDYSAETAIPQKCIQARASMDLFEMIVVGFVDKFHPTTTKA